METVHEKIVDWLLNGETGISSENIVRRFLGQTLCYGGEHPHDDDDFKRCLKLLDAIPELRLSLHLMADVSPQWKVIVTAWGKIEAKVREERGPGLDKKTTRHEAYEYMQGLLRESRVAFQHSGG